MGFIQITQNVLLIKPDGFDFECSMLKLTNFCVQAYSNSNDKRISLMSK